MLERKPSHWPLLGNAKIFKIRISLDGNVQSHSSDGADMLHRKYKPASLQPTSQPEIKLTQAELLVLAKNKVKRFQPEKGRSSLSDSSGGNLFNRVPSPSSSSEGCGAEIEPETSTHQLHWLRSVWQSCRLVSQTFFLKFPKFHHDR